MLTIHPGRTLAAGALLGMTLSGLVYSQEGLQPPTNNPATKLGLPQSVPETYGKPKSPYQPMLSEAAGPNTALGIKEEFEPPGTVAPANPTCVSPTGTSLGQSLERPSLWQRFKSGMQRRFLGYPEEFIAPPLGEFVYLHARTQVANGVAARMVLYDYDFIQDSDQLKPRGRHQLAKITTLLPCNFFPIVIEEIPDAFPLNEARRRAILHELGRYPFPVPAERVVIGRPIAIGLPSEEAEINFSNRLNFTRQGGPIPAPQLGTGIGPLRYPFGVSGGGAGAAGGTPGGGGSPGQ